MAASQSISLQKVTIAALLVISILAIYHPVCNFNFINFDDPEYVQDNPHVQGGLTKKNILWAFSNTEMGHWIPLTSLSFMLDREIYGPDPGGYHWTNVMLHTVNSLLLFLLLSRITGLPLRSGFAAAIFALHPLHVESVAWITERKDVLSVFFGLLSLSFYAHYAERRSFVRYLAVLVFFLLGLMAKSMLVTMPIIMLLLDYWPLGRFTRERKKHGLAPLIIEKIPFFILSAGASLMAVYAAHSVHALSSVEAISIGDRLANSVVAYSLYMGKIFWPVKLAFFYPHSGNWPFWIVAGSVLLLLSITLTAICLIKRAPYIFVGWSWFVCTLLPVIGLIQVGSQEMADRYMYLPMIGFSMPLVWASCEILAGTPYRRAVPGLAGCMICAAMILLSAVQVTYWKNSLTLMRHAIRVTDKNYIAYHNLGLELMGMNRFDEAIVNFNKAIEYYPFFTAAYLNRAEILNRQGKYEEAIALIKKTLYMGPASAKTYYRLGAMYYLHGQMDNAGMAFRNALRYESKNAAAHNYLGLVYLKQCKLKPAETEFLNALDCDPGHAGAHNNLAMLYLYMGRLDNAISHFRDAISIEPSYANAHYYLSAALRRKGDQSGADSHYWTAVRINPSYGKISARNLAPDIGGMYESCGK